jgi:DNA-binding response OmpR family regulator
MRILIVEDEHRIAQSIKKGLEQERYAVDVAYTGSTGLDLALSEEYDIVILDLMLPEIDGLEVCRQMRAAGIQTPVLMLTAKSQIHDKVAGLDTGADDYLTKPFSFEELVARVRALSRRPKNTLNTILTVGDLSLNPHTFEVKRDNQTITLSNKEFALLEYLMRRSPTILSKDQIISHVWDYDADILANTVEVYMRNLRNKIDEPFKPRSVLLHTVRGFGYKLEAEK